MANVHLASSNQHCSDAFCHPAVRYFAILIFMSITLTTILASFW